MISNGMVISKESEIQPVKVNNNGTAGYFTTNPKMTAFDNPVITVNDEKY